MAAEQTETRPEGVYTETGGETIVQIHCLFCGGLIEKPRKGKRFCSNKHRWFFHNTARTKETNELKAFAEEINDLLEKHGLLRK